jgi:hypothetical protein
METSKLKEILDQHRLWLNGKGGKCASLKDADLCGAYLRGANLNGANLSGADLYYANLTGANLTDADLTDAKLTGANLTDANLTDANLTGADLQNANLKDAILPDVSWIIPGCLVQLNRIKYNGFWLMKECKWVNFVQYSFGFFIQNNPEEDTFDMLLGDRIIRGIPDWVKYSGLKQNASESV